MVHPPARRRPLSIWTWVQRVQLAAAFIIAQLDTGWEEFAATAHPAVAGAWTDGLDRRSGDYRIGTARPLTRPGAVPEVATLYIELLRSLPSPGGVPYLNALLVWSFALPGATPELRREAERAWKTMMG